MGRKGVKTSENLLSEDEISRIKNAISEMDIKERLVINTLLYSGMRVTEFIHMRKEWIDWNSGIIKLPQEQKCECSGCIKTKGIWKPKTKEATRSIPLFPDKFPELEKILKEYFETHNTVMETVSNRPGVWYSIEKVRKKANIEHKLFPQVFRGTYANQLIKSKIDSGCIKNILGWKSIILPHGEARTEGDIKTEINKKLKPF